MKHRAFPMKNAFTLPTGLTATLASLFGAMSAPAALIVTYAENPNSVTSSLPNTSRYSFNDLAVNAKNTNVVWSGVGTFDAIYVKSADQYGGAVDPGYANGSPYAVQSSSIGGSSKVPTTTLTLNEAHAYFGLWWSAGDATNVLGFYNGNTLVAQFTTASLLNELASDSSYKGNPRNRTLNSGESYAFINFFGQDGTSWDKIVFTNSTSSGFESDNYTDRLAPWTPDDGPMPGIPIATVTGTSITVVPEPATVSIPLLAMAALITRRRRIG